MCTLTWRRDSSLGLEVYFSRDELKTRPVADPPSRFEVEDFAFLSPRDPLGTGTWMLVNDRAVVICLLNKWELEGREVKAPLSRGRLVWSLAGLGSIDEVEDALGDLSHYQAFTLVAFCPMGDRCWEWDGMSLVDMEVPDFLTSSSFQFKEVKEAREGCFATGQRGEELHSSAGKEPSAYTVLMNRPDAQTWSRSRLRVGKKVTWEYLAEQRDLQGEAELFVSELSLR